MLNTPVKMVLKNKKPLRWSYDLNEDLKCKSSESLKFLKGLGSWQPELFDEVVKKDGLEKMIQKLNFDDTEIINDFMSSKESDTRKSYIQNHNFSIASL